ncbi:venom dipeptidyl peptidase 4 isoform X2 [Thrips palmi]|uniref:Venom dipeptidyl peptidase 4 n=1 Tax=Thrips palmi TaxID=161013 RepID=A0A6P8YTF0_THRPL|nr:venom dipeptidyl peptidase 4 isoform X2 [Thrips palmi]XP_034243318.1 venom dipeptidyl peptidase 4 isoform X2 [Thrips palmi]XP_034243319.1 venom dipeptidyl peptidase 4 isoform X2 [Thrips palmi]
MSGGARNGASSHSLEMANSNQELVTRANKARRWKILGLLIAAGITAAVLTTVLVLVLRKAPDDARGEALTMDDFLSRRFTPRQFNASWISDSELFYDDGTSSLNPVIYDVNSKQRRQALGPSVHLDLQAFQTELSADSKYSLESYSYRSLYRHSYIALYNLIDVETGVKTPLTIPDRPGPVYAQVVVWAPVGSALTFVVGNDIYYRSEATAASVRITATGVQDTIYNGVPDWVYEEEVLSGNKALWFAPDGSRLAYVTYNDTAVPFMTLPYYGRPGELLFQYTRAYNIRYPKPGKPNPEVTLTVVDPANPSAKVGVPPPMLLNHGSDSLILAVTQWVPDTPNPRLLTVWMNRVQNHAVVELVDVHASPVVRVVVAELSEPDGWVDLFENGVTAEGAGGQGSVLLPLSHAVDDDSFRHIARFDPNEDRTKYTRTDLTTGAFVVTSILAWDSDNGYVYFVSTKEGDPGQSLVQRVRDDPKGAPHVPECLSCNLTNCMYATASLSKKNGYVALTCAGPDVPYTAILSTKGSPSRVMDWEQNDAVRHGLVGKRLPTKKRLTADLPQGFKAEVMLWLPPDADLSGSTKYPMLVDVYGGPNSFRVSERFAMDWGTFLSANKSVIYAAIDGRGSANKGDKTVFSINRRFGTYEVEDQINVTRHLQNTLPYVDASRTAIWGWSYGGYASAMALAEDTSNVFKCGMSVAPVTDWIYYDSIYTERYMGLPTEGDNRAGYRRAQLTNKVENLRHKLFLLIHGTLDDNVHYQQSMILSRALEENDILFRQQTYPDEEHGIVQLQKHLYHTLENFLGECFAEF